MVNLTGDDITYYTKLFQQEIASCITAIKATRQNMTIRFDEVNFDVLSMLQLKKYVNEDALKQIEQGTFGTCKKCHKPIPKVRLEVAFCKTYCADCCV